MPSALRELLAHVRERDVFAGDGDGLADVLRAGLEDAVGRLADVVLGDARQLGVAHRERPAVDALVVLLRREAEEVEVVPVERHHEERGRQAGEVRVGFRLRVEVRDAVLALEHRHPRVVGRHQLARVFERRPDDVLDAGGLGRVGDVLRLGDFLLAGEVLPEVRDGEDAVRARERLLQALDVVEIGRRRLPRPSPAIALALSLDGVARDGAGGEAAVRVGENRRDEAAALRRRSSRALR